MKNWQSAVGSWQVLSTMFLFFICSAFLLQDYKHIQSISVNGKFITTDNLQNFYVVTDANELVKFNSSGEKLFVYSEKSFGKLSFADASNPFKILAFYPEYSTAVALDKTLSPIGQYNLRKAGILRAGAVCLAQDNNIWVYDEQDFRFKKIDENLKIIQQSDDLSLLIESPLRPNFMLERNGWIFLNDPKVGILRFDNYATYFKTIPMKELDNFQVIGDRIFYFKGYNLKSYSLFKPEEQSVSLPDTSSFLQGRVEKNMLYLLREKQVDLYSF